jgi:RNA-directed DNA polymerase
MAVIPKNCANEGGAPPAERWEGRAVPEENGQQDAASWTQRQGIASTGLLAVRQAAQRDKTMQFTALLHHIDRPLLRKSYYELKRNAAPGSDGISWAQYGEQLEERLTRLHERIQRGSYRAQPARRVYIPKADGSERPLSIQCLEDKIVQQAVVQVLNAIYEVDFLAFSYGFRPGRGQHDALDALHVGLYSRKVNWVLDADIRKFFDSMDHDWMMRFLQHRIADRRLLRLIRKWLKVGIAEEGQRVPQERGAPQGAVISPILANVYLHYAYDLWVNQWRKRHALGEVIVVRYADDTLLGFEHRQDAEAFRCALSERLERFGLALHSQKTRLLQFGRYARQARHRAGLGKPETFDFLGFTHFCSEARGSGRFVIGRKTIAKRMRAQLAEIKAQLRRRLHRPVHETGRWLNRVLRGHLAYYAVPLNIPNISAFFYQVGRLWIRALRRRSQRSRMTWERFSRLRARYFPRIRTMYPLPGHRFDAKTRGRSPVR